MTSDTSPRPVSPLRARMIEDMTVRGFKGAETDMPGLPPLRHTSTLPKMDVQPNNRLPRICNARD